jgi:hypothetical protein
MKTLYTKTKTWTLGLALCCLSVVGSVNAAAPGGPPSNDLCSGAITINCGDALAGTNVDATEQSVPSYNGGSVGQGVWYSFTGTGGNITLTTCGASFDTEINVVTSPDCVSYTNVAGNDDGASCSPASEVTFLSLPGELYYVYVSDWITAGGYTGTFTLTMTCAAPSNDLCGGAITVACGDVVTGNTLAATATDIPTGPFSISEGLWYAFTGTGDNITVSTCSAADFDTEISVSSGSCGSLTWVGGNDDFSGCASSTSEYTFPSTNGTMYYIYVGDWSSAVGSGGGAGTFDLSVTCTPTITGPANDDCANAIALACGDVVSGSTALATADAEVSGVTCGSYSATAPGVWYTVVGTGLDITASLCGSAYDTKLFIYEGACGSLACVGGNDDVCDLQSEITWTSTYGTTYSIWVTGYGSATGAFNLAITCVRPSNDDCANAEVIACGDVVAGTNVGASEQLIPTYSAGTVGAGVWYVFTGTGNDVTLGTCNDASFDTEINVLTTSDCVNFTNVAGNDDFSGCSGSTSQVTFTSVASQTYYVYVSDWVSGGGNAGTFNLTLTCVAPANDLCSNAEAIACGDVVAGSNYGATEQTVTTFNGFTVGAGVWYVFTGTGGDVTLSTCGNANFDTEINVITTADCMDYTNNVAGNDDFSGCLGGTSEVTFTSVASQTYYVYVSDWVSGGGNQGTFNLSLTCDPVTGISQALENGISVYPNPSNGQFVLAVNGVDADAQIIVMDVAGRQVYTEGVTMNGSFRKELNLNVASGTYLLQVATVDGTVTRKIQIN